jgi:hypothetical protein
VKEEEDEKAKGESKEYKIRRTRQARRKMPQVLRAILTAKQLQAISANTDKS